MSDYEKWLFTANSTLGLSVLGLMVTILLHTRWRARLRCLCKLPPTSEPWFLRSVSRWPMWRVWFFSAVWADLSIESR